MALGTSIRDPFGSRKRSLEAASRQSNYLLERPEETPDDAILTEIVKIHGKAARAARKLGFEDYAENHREAQEKALAVINQEGDPETLTAALISQLRTCTYLDGEL